MVALQLFFFSLVVPCPGEEKKMSKHVDEEYERAAAEFLSGCVRREREVGGRWEGEGRRREAERGKGGMREGGGKEKADGS